MDLFQTRIQTNSSEFQNNRDRMAQLVTELKRRTELARQGGGEKYLERHRSQGKLPVRDRIEKLLSSLDKRGEPTAYLFRCLHCGARLAYWDIG